MNKQDFLHQLAGRLAILSKDEREDMLSEYAQHIDLKIATGLSEEEAVASFGDFDELTNELLSAYHIDPDYDAEDMNRPPASGWYMMFRRFTHFFTCAMEGMFNKSSRDIGRIAFRSIILVIALLSLRFLLGFSGALFQIRGIYHTTLGFFLRNILGIATEVVFLIIVFYAAYLFIKRYIIEDYTPLSDEEAGKPFYRQTITYDATTPTADEEQDAFTANTAPRSKVLPKPRTAEDDRFFNFFALCVKVILFLIALPMLIAFFGMLLSAVVGLGVALFLAISGLPLWGVSIATFGLLLSGIALILAIWHVVTKGGQPQ